MMLLDVPITSSEQDAFGRKKAAERCARRLSDIRSDTAFVVGLSGDWGSGKTSFVNMVKEALGNSDEKTTVVDFNAWLYSSQEQLVRQFFSEVSRAVEKNAAKNVGRVAAKELGNTLSEYSEAISEAGINLAGALIPQLLVLNKMIPAASTAQKYVWKRVLQRASDALKGGDKTIEQLREEVSKSLSKLDGNIVVVIDDVDRLPQEDIRALFKLVNLTASFPRMTYLLSYDGSVVRKALAGVQGTDGSDYLDKIVQLPIDLPQPSMDVLRSKLEEVIGPYVNASGFELDRSERTRLLRVFDSFVMRSIRTPRQVKRYLNRLEVMRDDVENEICPVDVIGMTGIFLFHPVLANWIWEWRDDICTSDRVLTSLDMRISDQTIDALVSEAFPDADEAAMLLDALPTLFPDLTYVLGDHNYRRMHIGRETGRVAHLDNLELVYATADGVEVRRDELLGLATEATDDDLKRNILKLDRRGQLNRLIETMEMRRPNLSNDRKATICGAFLDTLGSLKRDEACFCQPIVPQFTMVVPRSRGGEFPILTTGCPSPPSLAS